METTTFIWNILLYLWLLSVCCKSLTLSTKEEIALVKSANTSINTKNNVPSNSLYKTLVLCKCGSYESMDHTGQCQIWTDGTNIPVGENHHDQQSVNTREFNIKVHEPECQNQEVDLQEGQFVLRHRGDLLVTQGAHQGLRLSDYCIDHHQSEGKIKVTARGCVPVPLIPRCCAEGNHIENGGCVPTTMDLMPFNPPLATGPHGDDGLAGASFSLVDHQEYFGGMPDCSAGYTIKKVILDGIKAYLAALPQNVLLTWHPDDIQRKYSEPPQYCVDGPGKGDMYFAYSCQENKEDYCKNKSCVKKCCPEGQSLSLVSRQCVPSDSSFKSLLPSSNSVEIFYGWPNCAPITHISKYTLSPEGTLLTEDDTHPFDMFCIDNFIKENSIGSGALVCSKGIQPTLWHNVRRVLFPVCIGLSCAFLVLLLLLNAWIPKLRAKEDSNMLLHATSLLLAFSVTLLVQVLVPLGYVIGNNCVALALVMQFAFLSAFFWLNTMCFDMWRLSRNLVRNNCITVPKLAVWKYMLYAFGGPLIITVTTIIIQFVAPSDGSISWLVHPRIGEGRCWFYSDRELLTYFYGPIAVLFLLDFILIGITYYYLMIIRGDNTSTRYPIKSDFFAVYWQRFYLLALVTVCWLTEILSWLIPFDELWAATDILNNLQGVFVFLIFLSPRSKRTVLKDKILKLFKLKLCSYTSVQKKEEPISIILTRQ